MENGVFLNLCWFGIFRFLIFFNLKRLWTSFFTGPNLWVFQWHSYLMGLYLSKLMSLKLLWLYRSSSSSVGTLFYIPQHGHHLASRLHISDTWIASQNVSTVTNRAFPVSLDWKGDFQNLHVAYQTLLPRAKSCVITLVVQACLVIFMSTTIIHRRVYVTEGLWEPLEFSAPTGFLPSPYTSIHSRGLWYSKFEVGTAQTMCADSTSKNLGNST